MRSVPLYPYLRMSASTSGCSPKRSTPGAMIEQLASVGDRHARAIYRLVRDPGGAKFVGLHYGDDLSDRLLEDGDVLLAGPLCRLEIGF